MSDADSSGGGASPPLPAWAIYVGTFLAGVAFVITLGGTVRDAVNKNFPEVAQFVGLARADPSTSVADAALVECTQDFSTYAYPPEQPPREFYSADLRLWPGRPEGNVDHHGLGTRENPYRWVFALPPLKCIPEPDHGLVIQMHRGAVISWGRLEPNPGQRDQWRIVLPTPYARDHPGYESPPDFDGRRMSITYWAKAPT